MEPGHLVQLVAYLQILFILEHIDITQKLKKLVDGKISQNGLY